MVENQIELLNILIDRTSYINTYWNFYIIVTTFIIGVIVSDKVNLTKSIRLVMSISFILFAISNYHGIHNLNTQREILIGSITSDLSLIAETFKPDIYLKYLIFHLILDCIVLFSINKINIMSDKVIDENG